VPELPEIQGLAGWLDRTLTGQPIEHVRLRSVSALKTYDPPISALAGRRLDRVSRRGKFLSLHAGDLQLALHLSRAGWLRWSMGETSRKPSLRGPILLELRFSEGMLDVTEQGHEKRVALWLVHRLDEVPQIAELGPDALDPELDEEHFHRLLTARSGTVKRALADQRVIAGIGNAYSDEILHSARISPFTRTSRLGPAETRALRDAMRSILSSSVTRAVALEGRQLKDDKRSHFSVHGRTGLPCPVCGDTIHEVWSAGRSFQYCPGCQTGGRVYADRRLSRLLK